MPAEGNTIHAFHVEVPEAELTETTSWTTSRCTG